MTKSVKSGWGKGQTNVVHIEELRGQPSIVTDEFVSR